MFTFVADDNTPIRKLQLLHINYYGYCKSYKHVEIIFLKNNKQVLNHYLLCGRLNLAKHTERGVQPHKQMAGFV